MSLENYLDVRRKAPVRKTQHHGAKPPEIEKGIPIPQETRGGAHNFSHFYPFEEMEVGDSFWIKGSTGCTKGAVSDFAKKTGRKFTCRSQSKDGRSNKAVGKEHRGLRVWRIA